MKKRPVNASEAVARIAPEGARVMIGGFMREATRDGHVPWPLVLDPGDMPADRYVDTPPYRTEPHLRVRYGRFAVTSLGLAIQAAPSRAGPER